MARGNQREMAKEKAAKKDKGKVAASADQGANKGMSKEARMERWEIILGSQFVNGFCLLQGCQDYEGEAG